MDITWIVTDARLPSASSHHFHRMDDSKETNASRFTKLRNLTGCVTTNDCHPHNQSSFPWLDKYAETHTLLEYGLPQFGDVTKGHIRT